MATRTYSVGPGGIIKRLDNLTTPWVNISSASTEILRDVKTHPSNPDRVFVVGNNNTILVSTNAGATWNIPAGNYNSLGALDFYEVWVVNANIIYVCGTSGLVAKSTDGGLNFNFTAAPATPSGAEQPGIARAVHFITPLTGIVTFDNHVMKTTNGGASWTELNGGSPIAGTLYLSGVHLSQDQQTIVTIGLRGVYRSTNAGATFGQVVNYPAQDGIHLTWFDDDNLWATAGGTDRRRSIDGGATWTILSPHNLSGINVAAAHFYSLTNGFFGLGQQVLATTNSGLSGTLSDTYPIKDVQAIWTLLDPSICYTITDCSGQQPTLTVGNDLSAYVDQVVSFENRPGCWLIGVAPDSAGACRTVPSLIVAEVHVDCNACNTPCWELTDCSGEKDPIVTSTDLSAYVGQVITVLGCGDTCWSVAAGSDCTSVIDVEIGPVVFATCVACLPAVVVPEPVLAEPRPSDPGFTTQGCSPEEVLRVNCAFVDEVWKVVKKMRYGVSSCCGDDELDRFSIKKDLVDLQAIYDPEACVVQPVCPPPCCAPCNVSAVINAFMPIACLAPENVSAILSVECLPPSDLEVELTVTPCVCYEVFIPHPTTATYEYTDCSGNPQSVFDLEGTYYVCAIDLPIFVGPVAPNATITPTVFPCDGGVCGP